MMGPLLRLLATLACRRSEPTEVTKAFCHASILRGASMAQREEALPVSQGRPFMALATPK